jgi:hypothetical protein
MKSKNMKNHTILFSLLMLISCSEKQKNAENDMDFKLTRDTVVIDANGSIINLKYGLTNPELSQDGKFLYHYTHGEAKFDKIDLENMILDETLQFEKEGPNGMGRYIGGYALTSDDQFMIWSYGLHAIFDQTGKKVRDLKLSDIAPETGGSEVFPIRLMIHPNDLNQLFGLYVKWEGYQYFLLKFDLENETFNKILLPETEKLDDYQMEIEHDGRPAGGFGPKPMVNNIVDNKIVLTSGPFNEAYIYDINLDTLYMVSWNSELTGNQNEYKLPKTVEMGEAEMHRKKYNESINFLPPRWDPVSKRFIRLSYKTIFGEEMNEYGEAKEIGADVFLTVMDKNFNIVKETFLENYRKNPRMHFYKDNKIWLYENIEDELGFIRITVD